MPAKSSKKQRKYGRTKNKPCHQVYNMRQQWLWNKVKRIVKHLKKFPNYKPYKLSPDIRAEVKKQMEKNG